MRVCPKKPFGRLNPSVSVFVHMSYQMFEHFLRYGNLVETNPSTWMCFCSYSKGDHCWRKSSEASSTHFKTSEKHGVCLERLGKSKKNDHQIHRWSSNCRLWMFMISCCTSLFLVVSMPHALRSFRQMSPAPMSKPVETTQALLLLLGHRFEGAYGVVENLVGYKML